MLGCGAVAVTIVGGRWKVDDGSEGGGGGGRVFGGVRRSLILMRQSADLIELSILDEQHHPQDHFNTSCDITILLRSQYGMFSTCVCE